jgi:hypothetical protein
MYVIRMYVCIDVCMDACEHVCLYACTHARMHAYACLLVCMHVFMYVSFVRCTQIHTNDTYIHMYHLYVSVCIVHAFVYV